MYKLQIIFTVLKRKFGTKVVIFFKSVTFFFFIIEGVIESNILKYNYLL